MPIYEYACSSCGHRFEKKQSFSDEPIAACPECAASVRRVLHPAGIIFKGSGWYITDSRKSSGSENGSTSSEPAAGKTESATPAGSSKSES